MWICTAYNLLYYESVVKRGGSEISSMAIQIALASALTLEPLSIFMYTWRFIYTLERDEERDRIKTAYRWFSKITLWAVPLINVGSFIINIILQV